MKKLFTAILSLAVASGSAVSVIVGCGWSGEPAAGRSGPMSRALLRAGAPALAAGRQPDARPEGQAFNTEAYDRIVENAFRRAADHPLSTFSIDVDTASYSNLRRFLAHGQLPPKGAVRIEELINYFPYRYAGPAGDEPFAVHADLAGCPWKPEHRLLRVALKGREIAPDQRPATNLVFLLDVSGSMSSPRKLALVKQGLRLLVRQLDERDRVAIVVYAGASGLVLPPTSCDRPERILPALDQLHAGGSTNGGEGIRLAYRVAVENFLPGGANRVILCTDGDFNVGTTSQSELIRLIERKAGSGVFLTVLGFGMGNYKDSTLEKLADRGNGNYGYVDNVREAEKLFVRQLTGTLVTIAKDVKIQIEFNPAQVEAYRLIGYENRLLSKEDFNDDTRDAGDIGAGHTVTALYELIPAGEGMDGRRVDPLKYQRSRELTAAAAGDEALTVKLRYKAPDGDVSRRLTRQVVDEGKGFAEADGDFRFAASVAGFGMLLRDSSYKGSWTVEAVQETASTCRGADPGGYRAEFIELVTRARPLMDG